MEKNVTFSRKVFSLSLLLFTSLLSFAQTRFPVTGRITDNTGAPVENATVQESGTRNIALTKKDGSFSINASSGTATLLISSVGFESQQVPLSNQSQVAVSLK